jgi:hypothetical protein
MTALWPKRLHLILVSLALALAAGLAAACGPAAEPTSALPTGTAPVAGPTTVPISITAPVTGSQPTLVITTPVVGPPRTPTPVTAPGTSVPIRGWSEEEILRTKEALRGRKPSKELLDLYDEYQAHVQRQGSAEGFKPSHSWLQVRNGLVVIQAVPFEEGGKALLRDLEALGLQRGITSRWTVSGLLPIAALGSLDQLENLKYVTAVAAPGNN